MSPRQRHSFTLAIHPTTRGFGWVLFEGPFAPFDWGMCDARQEKNRTCLKRAEALIRRYQPHTLVLEAFEPKNSRRSDRIARFGRAMVALAADRGLEVAIYTRSDVRSCFASVGARSREEIAEAVARHIDAFEARLPKRRRCWQPEDYRLALFSAAALVSTHYQRGSSQVFEQLGDLPHS
jgi:hypothetical protein